MDFFAGRVVPLSAVLPKGGKGLWRDLTLWRSMDLDRTVLVVVWSTGIDVAGLLVELLLWSTLLIVVLMTGTLVTMVVTLVTWLVLMGPAFVGFVVWDLGTLVGLGGALVAAGLDALTTVFCALTTLAFIVVSVLASFAALLAFLSTTAAALAFTAVLPLALACPLAFFSTTVFTTFFSTVTLPFPLEALLLLVTLVTTAFPLALALAPVVTFFSAGFLAEAAVGLIFERRISTAVGLALDSLTAADLPALLGIGDLTTSLEEAALVDLAGAGLALIGAGFSGDWLSIGWLLLFSMLIGLL